MNPFLNQRARRNTAFAVLLLWLLSLAASVAHACLLEAPLVPFHIAASLSPRMAGTLNVVGHGVALDTSKALCLKVCEVASQSLPTSQPGVDLTDPGSPGLVAVLWAASAPVALVSHQRPHMQLATSGPSIRLRYARLLL